MNEVVQVEACPGAHLQGADLRGAHLRHANLEGIDLRDADLRGADLTSAYLYGADLRGADLSGAVLSYACLSKADLRGAKLPVAPSVTDLHSKVYEAASQPGALDMSAWHRCSTTHCRAGWAVVLAGDEGMALEAKFGTGVAAALIYMASYPDLERVPDWDDSDHDALLDMKRLAENERGS